MIGVYCIKNKINNKRYIGQSINIENRLVSHKRNEKSILLVRAFEKYGLENFDFFVLEECSQEKLDDRERFYIKLFKSNDLDFGYNLTEGGEHGIRGPLSKESLAKKKKNM